MDNPFIFGMLVDEPYFTDREKELSYIKQFLSGGNHLILISPRRYGKSSLVRKAVKETGRPCVWLNMQDVLSKEDLAVKLMKAIFRQYRLEKIKHLLRNFHIIPAITTNPFDSEVSVTFQPAVDNNVILEDVMDLLQKVSSPDNRLIVVFDEFQEILEVEKGIDRQLRAIMQEQFGLNYIFMGSQESMMTDIFERVQSPFYHFGQLMRIDKIPYDDFHLFLQERFKAIAAEAGEIASEILAFTLCHPYYTQQLASTTWDLILLRKTSAEIVGTAIREIIRDHDLDYERLWLTLNKTDQRTISLLSLGENPVQQRRLPTSTVTSSLKRLQQKGYIVKTDKYELEDPFFKKWVNERQKG